VISLIRSYGILISAGHSNATFQQATAAFNAGVDAVTHLYNAMSPLHHREPGLTGAALLHSAVRASVIPDGYHVDFNAIRIAKTLMGERLFAITDAVTATTEGPYQHHLADDKFEAGGILSGSALSMYGCFYNLVHKVQVEPGEALRMCSLYPAEVLGVDQQYGRIAPLQQACMAVLDSNWNFVQPVIPSAG
jgi:N-acetylglucosamine-6-phosphate deacetylase